MRPRKLFLLALSVFVLVGSTPVVAEAGIIESIRARRSARIAARTSRRASYWNQRVQESQVPQRTTYVRYSGYADYSTVSSGSHGSRAAYGSHGGAASYAPYSAPVVQATPAAMEGVIPAVPIKDCPGGVCPSAAVERRDPALALACSVADPAGAFVCRVPLTPPVTLVASR